MIKAYFHIYYLSVRKSKSLWMSQVSKILFFGFVLLAYSALWSNFANTSNWILYFIITEWIFLASSESFRQIESDIANGNVQILLNQPIDPFWSYLSMIWGQSTITATLVLFFGLFMHFFMFGFTQDFKQLPIVLIMGLMSIFTLTIFQFILHILRFWMENIRPIVLLWQKSALILGGVIIPLSFYPPWLKSASQLTPFYSTLFLPASKILTFQTFDWRLYGSSIVIWSLIGLILAKFLFQQGFKKLN